MTDKVEGTIVLEGLLEGSASDTRGLEEKLREWIEFLRGLGVTFSLEVRGNSFSLLPDNHPVSCEKLGASPDDAIRQAVEQLILVLPDENRGNVFSTLRSAEYRKREEVQTLYAVMNDGTVRAESRVVEADTSPPVAPIAVKHRIRLAVIGLVVAAIVVAITSLFVDLPGLVREVLVAAQPVDADSIEVDVSTFETYFTIESRKISSRGGTLLLTLERTKDFPLSEKQLQDAYESAGNSLSRRLIIEALARGYVRCEVFDGDGNLYRFTMQPIRDLQKRETATIAVPLETKRERRTGSVKITY